MRFTLVPIRLFAFVHCIFFKANVSEVIYQLTRLLQVMVMVITFL